MASNAAPGNGQRGGMISGLWASPFARPGQHLMELRLAPSAPAHGVLDEEADVAAGRRDVRRAHALDREPNQIVRAAGLGPRARQPFAAERLHPRHGADLIAVDIKVADARVLGDVVGDRADAAVQPERQAVAQPIDGPDHLTEMPALEADHVQDGPEYLALDQLQIG